MHQLMLRGAEGGGLLTIPSDDNANADTRRKVSSPKIEVTHQLMIRGGQGRGPRRHAALHMWFHGLQFQQAAPSNPIL